MSSILKALRKVEEEKRATTHAAPDLRSDHGTAEARFKPYLFLLSGAALGALCLGALLFFAAGQDDTPTQVEEAVVQEAQPPAKIQPEIKVAPQEDKILVINMPPEPVPVQSAPLSKTTPVKQKAKPKPPFVRPEETARTAKPTAAVVPSVTARQSAVKDLPAGVALTVSEIFYQDDTENSMAVVNELPVMVGTLVDSAFVAEIHPEYVIFDIEGTRYTVPSKTP